MKGQDTPHGVSFPPSLPMLGRLLRPHLKSALCPPIQQLPPPATRHPLLGALRTGHPADLGHGGPATGSTGGHSICWVRANTCPSNAERWGSHRQAGEWPESSYSLRPGRNGPQKKGYWKQTGQAVENYGGRGLVMQEPGVGLGYCTSHQWQDKDNNLNNSSCYDLLAS